MKSLASITSESVLDASHPFWKLWPLAHVFHVFNNPARLCNDGLTAAVDLLLVVVCGLAVYRTSLLTVRLLSLAFSLQVLSLEVLSNHVIVMACFNAFVLLAAFRRNSLQQWSSFARVLVLLTYFAAGFHKLNSDFFNTHTSCANVLVQGAGGLFAGSSAWPAIAVLVEFMIPTLLVSKRFTIQGIWLGVIFHIALAIHPSQSVFGFSGPMMALLTAFAVAQISDRTQKLCLLAAGVAVVIALLSVVHTISFYGLASVAHIFIHVGLIGYLVLLAFANLSVNSSKVRWSSVSIVILSLFMVNALTPYFGVDSVHAMNMYSNLYVGEGRTNHWLIRKTFGPWSAQPIAVIEASNVAPIIAHQEQHYGIVESDLSRYLSDSANGWVEFHWLGDKQKLRQRWTSDAVTSARYLPVAFATRPVDLETDTRCLRSWVGLK